VNIKQFNPMPSDLIWCNLKFSASNPSLDSTWLQSFGFLWMTFFGSKKKLTCPFLDRGAQIWLDLTYVVARTVSRILTQVNRKKYCSIVEIFNYSWGQYHEKKSIFCKFLWNSYLIKDICIWIEIFPMSKYHYSVLPK